jgi:hypothetical protein
MEEEFNDPAPYYYSGSGQFYSPQLVRSLSETGQTSSSGTGGGGGNSDASTNVPVLPIIGIAEFWASFFDWLFGGSSAPPTPRQLRHGRHPLYPDILGVSDGLTEASAVPMPEDGAPSTDPPLQKPASLISRIGHCVAEHYGLTAVAAGLWALGIKVPKALLGIRKGFQGTIRYTSLIRGLGFKVFGEAEPSIGVSLLCTTRVLGIIGRAAPFVSGALFAYDAISIAYCVERQN